ncbi:MAG: exosortase C-terminal domain/associated protein EpsI [Myxococcota bacterium]
MTKLLAALGFLALNFYIYNFFASEAVYPEREEFTSFPLELEGGWVCSELGGITDEVRKELGVTDFLLCDFRNAERARSVNVYVGYHASQVREGRGDENSIHPPAHCLPGSGWDIIRNETVPIGELSPVPGATAKRLVIAKGKFRQIVYYWYQSRGRVISQDWQKILFVGLDRATRKRTDGSLVRFTVPYRQGDETRAEDALIALASQVISRLPAYVPN